MNTLPKSGEQSRVVDRRIEKTVPLVTPQALHDQYPLDDDLARTIADGRQAVADVLNGVDDRLLVVVGPCSVHDADAALEYAERLRPVAERLSDGLLVVMRVYFEKPRSTLGWKGLINDPGLDGSGDVNRGLRIARRLLVQVSELGLPVGCEFLDPITPQYIADTVGWGAIGARTVESQVHRQLSSGLSMPIGMKNRPDGSIGTAVDAIKAAAVPHVFTGIDHDGAPAILHTRGNPDCHLVLRGSDSGPNYDAESVAGEIGAQVAAGNRAIVGVMLESFLAEGRQDLDPTRELTYGQSITDACLGWDTPEEVLQQLRDAAVARRG